MADDDDDDDQSGRFHSALGYQTPQEVYDEYLNRQIAA